MGSITALSADAPEVPELSGAVDFYVNGSTGNDSNDGSIANPVETIGRATEIVTKERRYFNSAENPAIVAVHVADNSYPESLIEWTFRYNAPSRASIIGQSKAGVIIQGDGVNEQIIQIIDAGPGSFWDIDAVTIGTDTYEFNIVKIENSKVRLDNIDYKCGALDGDAVINIERNADVTIGGTSVVTAGEAGTNFVLLNDFARVSQDADITFSGTTEFSDATIQVEENSTYRLVPDEGAAFTGTVTGKRFSIAEHSAINGEQDLTFIPGDSDGTINVGCHYADNFIQLEAVTSNNSAAFIPANCAIRSIAIKNTTANAVTGGIRIGTTSSGTQVVVAQAVGANALLVIADADVLLNIFSATTSQQLFIEAVTDWNSASLDITITFEPLYNA